MDAVVSDGNGSKVRLYDVPSPSVKVRSPPFLLIDCVLPPLLSGAVSTLYDPSQSLRR